MKTVPRVPFALQIVAVGFLLCGLCSISCTINSLLRGHLSLDVGVFGVPAFFGLRRFSNGWRMFALVYLLVAALIVVLMTVDGFSHPVDAAHLYLGGFQITALPHAFVFVISATALLLVVLPFCVLMSTNIRKLFLPPSPSIQPPNQSLSLTSDEGLAVALNAAFANAGRWIIIVSVPPLLVCSFLLYHQISRHLASVALPGVLLSSALVCLGQFTALVHAPRFRWVLLALAALLIVAGFINACWLIVLARSAI